MIDSQTQIRSLSVILAQPSPHVLMEAINDFITWRTVYKLPSGKFNTAMDHGAFTDSVPMFTYIDDTYR